MNHKSLFILISTLFHLFTQRNETIAQTPAIYLDPIFHVNYGDATADKPQSKSWTYDHQQWIIVGDADGPKLLKRDTLGWTSQSKVNRTLHSLPSRADVWKQGEEVDVVLVGDCALAFLKLGYDSDNQEYTLQSITHLPIPIDCNTLETATIVKDTENQYWICADINEKIMVWHSSDGKTWSDPIELANDINHDDISLIVRLQDQVSVIWSNQNTQSINERIHQDRDAPNLWSETVVVQQGDNNADDHLNATVFENGEMAMVTKNSVDKIDEPQFVLRWRDRKGKWTNIPFEKLTADRSPSRPIINHVSTGEIFEIHSVKNRKDNRYYISINQILKKEDDWKFVERLQLKTEINGKNGDATSSKDRFSSDEDKLIFFSDDLGNIYTFDLDRLLNH